MGTIHNKKKVKEKEKEKNKSKNFKEKIILTNDYEYLLFNQYGETPSKFSVYDIFKLNNINDSIFLTYLNKSENNIKILKYNFINKTTNEVDLEHEYPIKLKYFYDQIQNKEYLVELTQKELIIYLIKNDCVCEEIFKERKIFHDNVEIIYNQYTKTNYLIISKIFDYGKRGRIIEIYKFINNENVKVNEYKVIDYFACKREKLSLFWEDKISQKLYLITSSDCLLKFLEISENKNEFEHYFVQNEDYDYNFFACIINNANNKDYLYIFENKGFFSIFDLNEKEIISKNQTVKDIISIINWDNKYIIISTINTIYTFDTETNTIVDEYLIDTKEEIISIKKVNRDNGHPLYLSYATSDGIIGIINF